VALYHVEHRTGSSTLMLQVDNAGGWRVREHNGPFNNEVPAEAQRLVRSWVETSVAALLCPPPKVLDDAETVDGPNA